MRQVKMAVIGAGTSAHLALRAAEHLRDTFANLGRATRPDARRQP